MAAMKPALPDCAPVPCCLRSTQGICDTSIIPAFFVPARQRLGTFQANAHRCNASPSEGAMSEKLSTAFRSLRAASIAALGMGVAVFGGIAFAQQDKYTLKV